jgi:hypothetical protein
MCRCGRRRTAGFCRGRFWRRGCSGPEFQGRQIGSLTFEEIEKWEKTIQTRISGRGRPYARSVASGARSLLITILGDAVHAGRLDRNPAERRKGRLASHSAVQLLDEVLNPSGT